MMRCPRCGAEVSGHFCPNCGADLSIAAAQQYPAQPMPPQPSPYPGYPMPGYGMPMARPRPVWPGVVTLIVSIVVSGFVGLGLVALQTDLRTSEFVSNFKVGAYAIMGVACLVLAPFGITSLFVCRPAGKVMATIGMALAALVIFAISRI